MAPAIALEGMHLNQYNRLGGRAQPELGSAYLRQFGEDLERDFLSAPSAREGCL